MLPISLQRELAYGEPGVKSALRGSAFLSALGWLSIQIGTGSSAQGRVGPGKVHPKVGTGSSAQVRVHPRSAHPGRHWVLGSRKGRPRKGPSALGPRLKRGSIQGRRIQVGSGSSAQRRVLSAQGRSIQRSALGPRLKRGSIQSRHWVLGSAKGPVGSGKVHPGSALGPRLVEVAV